MGRWKRVLWPDSSYCLDYGYWFCSDHEFSVEGLFRFLNSGRIPSVSASQSLLQATKLVDSVSPQKQNIALLIKNPNSENIRINKFKKRFLEERKNRGKKNTSQKSIEAFNRVSDRNPKSNIVVEWMVNLMKEHYHVNNKWDS